MRKVAMLFIIILLITGVSFANFSDVTQDHWGYEAISKMESLGILTGYPDGTFNPNGNITLGEFATIFTKVFNIEPNTQDSYFTDVVQSHWAKGRLEAIREYIDPTYDPVYEKLENDEDAYMPGISAEMYIPREAVIFAIYRVYGFDEELYTPGEEERLFADYADILDPKSVCIAYKMGIIQGEVIDGKTYIRPARYIKRAEISSILRNLLGYNNKLENKEGFDVLYNVFKEGLANLEAYKVDDIKDIIYDPNGTLQQDKFAMSKYINKDSKSAINMFCGDFKHEMVSHGFTSYNHAYITLRIQTKDISKYIEMNKSAGNSPEYISKEIIPSFLKEYKLLNKIEKEITINFIKYDNEWKISL